MHVRPKKSLGQHFLTDKNTAQKITESLTGSDFSSVLEIGPGTGVLTDFLLDRYKDKYYAAELDSESVDFLNRKYPQLGDNLIKTDFLKFVFSDKFKDDTAVIGNFPYNISSQILFKVLEYKNLIPQVVGMFQKEVAERIASPPGSKVYGILSVLIQAYYKTEYLFTVHEGVFFPPPKVKSGVIRLTRLENKKIECDEKLFIRVVKTSFNQRRKTLHNSLKSITGGEKIDHPVMQLRPETLSVEEFVQLTNLIEKHISKQ